MNLVDSSAWLEFFADGPNADRFAAPITGRNELFVPTISIYEVFKRVLQQRSENEALQAVAIMQQGFVVDLDDSLALSAAKLSAENKLPMADSVILATARQFNAIVWTQDADVAGFDDVEYFEKQVKLILHIIWETPDQDNSEERLLMDPCRNQSDKHLVFLDEGSVRGEGPLGAKARKGELQSKRAACAVQDWSEGGGNTC